MWREIKPTGNKITKVETGERLLFSYLAITKHRMIMIISACTCTVPDMFVATYWCNNILLICPNPSLTPGRPDLQREERPAERIPHPPASGCHCRAGRHSEPPIRETSCCQSAKDDYVDDYTAAKLSPQHQQTNSPHPTSWATGPGRHHQPIISWLHFFGTCIWSWADTVTWVSRNGSWKVQPNVSPRDSWLRFSSQSSDEPSAWTQVDSSISFSRSCPQSFVITHSKRADETTSQRWFWSFGCSQYEKPLEIKMCKRGHVSNKKSAHRKHFGEAWKVTGWTTHLFKWKQTNQVISSSGLALTLLLSWWGPQCQTKPWWRSLGKKKGFFQLRSLAYRHSIKKTKQHLSSNRTNRSWIKMRSFYMLNIRNKNKANCIVLVQYYIDMATYYITLNSCYTRTRPI